MKKQTKELRGKSISDLRKESELLREEIGKKILHARINPDKNTNILFKMRKKLAVLLTILSEKEELGRIH